MPLANLSSPVVCKDLSVHLQVHRFGTSRHAGPAANLDSIELAKKRRTVPVSYRVRPWSESERDDLRQAVRTSIQKRLMDQAILLHLDWLGPGIRVRCSR
jgi:hypothetical protein